MREVEMTVRVVTRCDGVGMRVKAGMKVCDGFAIETDRCTYEC